MSVNPRHHSKLQDDKYRLLIESIVDYAVYMLTPSGMVSTWNPGAERLKGYREQDILGKHFSTFYSEQDRLAGLPTKALETAATTGKFEAEGWRIRKDGTRFWAYVVIDAIRSQAGELLGFAKITRDLTERRQAEEALKRSEEQFRLLVQSVTDYAIYMLTPDGIISSWNLGAQRIKGYAPEEIIGSHFSKFYTEADRARGEPQKALEAVRRDGRYEKEGWRVRRDGTAFWASVVIDAVRATTGEIVGFAKITRDITAQRESRLALEQAREALFQAQKMDSLGQLTGGVAHDFNNLLMVIQSSLELMRKRLPGETKLTNLMDNAMSGVRRGTALTQRMLAFARRQDLHIEAIDLPDLLKEMSDILERTIDPFIKIEMRFPLKLPPVLCDSNQLELALLNLVVNARDAMKNGGTIIISAREIDHVGAAGAHPVTGKYVCLAVTDTGEGMDEATLKRATEPFFTTKGIGKGTGLGLPMVLGLAHQSGGLLQLRSKLHEGTVAELWLPIASRSPVRAMNAEPISDQPIKSLNVLVVDDDNLVLLGTIAMLEDMGHSAIGMSSGNEALALVSTHADLDIVITDYAMPGMSGTELAQQLGILRPTLPIILATGYAETQASDTPKLIRLAKPYSQSQLKQSLIAAIS